MSTLDDNLIILRSDRGAWRWDEDFDDHVYGTVDWPNDIVSPADLALFVFKATEKGLRVELVFGN